MITKEQQDRKAELQKEIKTLRQTLASAEYTKSGKKAIPGASGMNLLERQMLTSPFE